MKRTASVNTASVAAAPGLVRHRISADPPPIADRLRELVEARDLYVLLVGRELRTRYKQTALGVIWVVLQPLVPAVIFGIVFGTFARLPSAGAPYFLFALAGFVIFGLFSSAVARAGTSFLRDGQLVTKVYFPRAVLPLAGGSAAIADFLVGLVVVLVLMAISGYVPTAVALAIPAIAIFMLAIALGFGLGISALSAHYRDFALAIPFLLQVLLYASPVVYSAELVPPSLRTLYWLNPLVAPIEAFRSVLLGTPAPSVPQIVGAVITGAATILIGALVFNRVSRDLADVI
jgi:lipopolysaccharide transport system permease protein